MILLCISFINDFMNFYVPRFFTLSIHIWYRESHQPVKHQWSAGTPRGSHLNYPEGPPVRRGWSQHQRGRSLFCREWTYIHFFFKASARDVYASFPDYRSHDSATGVVTHAWRQHARKFPSRATDSLTRGSTRKDLTCWIFTTGHGPWSRNLLWQKSKVRMRQSWGSAFCSCSVQCLLARQLVRRSVVRPLNRVVCGGLQRQCLTLWRLDWRKKKLNFGCVV